MKLVGLFERDLNVFLACEILNGGKVSELAEGDMDAVRKYADYFVKVTRETQLGDGAICQVDSNLQAYTYVEP